MRGNHAYGDQRRRAIGPIPAGAGEPIKTLPGIGRSGAYPRRCGGTLSSRAVIARSRGLSPQVRGNQRMPAASQPGGGPIPAGAGEPERKTSSRITARAYPRRCGGTTRKKLTVYWRRGLSPQVRGNLIFGTGLCQRNGPIPAGAGEPPSAAGSIARRRAYPRRCGGTTAANETAVNGAGLSPQVRGNR